MKIIIHAYAQKLRDTDNINPKNYPYWEELVSKLQKLGHSIIQVGLPHENKLVEDFRTINIKDLDQLLLECDTWIAVDSFFHHLAWRAKKPGIALFGPSNPAIFGHKENINLYKNKKYFRPDQFGIWEQCTYNKAAFVKPDEVIKHLNKLKPA